MENYFRGTSNHHFHISIGGVVVNDEGKICCHYFKTIQHPYYKDFKDFHLLLRETIEPNESIEACLARGLQEEFGIEAKLESYLGSTISHFPLVSHNHEVIEKTTLYFLCRFISIDESKRAKGDSEATSEIRWFEPRELILKLKEQGIRLGEKDMDESLIVERAINTGLI